MNSLTHNISSIHTVKLGDLVGLKYSHIRKWDWLPISSLGFYELIGECKASDYVGTKLIYQSISSKTLKLCVHKVHRDNVVKKHNDPACWIGQASDNSTISIQKNYVVKIAHPDYYKLIYLLTNDSDHTKDYLRLTIETLEKDLEERQCLDINAGI